MDGAHLYELVVVAIVFTVIVVLVFIAQFIMIIHNRNFVRERDEENQKRYKELSDQINETQGLFRKEVTQILNNFKGFLK